MREKRSSLAWTIKEAASQKVRDQLVATKFYQKSQSVACYLAMEEELDISPIIAQCWKEGKRCYLPVLDFDNAGYLQFGLYGPKTSLAKNKHNILEPVVVSPEQIIETQALDLVLLPLVAFDRTRNRLGMGGGYYDRTFSIKGTRASKPFLCGVAYSFQEVDSLPTEPWDKKLDAVITESEVIYP